MGDSVNASVRCLQENLEVFDQHSARGCCWLTQLPAIATPERR